ncbi:unnamed protein product [Cladocopium goreaui]|uniref:DNA (Cytosine-5)-methyltransferase 3A n=1 Tax=Cladocopium goreaui TaxID=2562237 RepID=A0A9P1DLL3_9DINO|nr:unnamed protein product [Cladocopium goreaui]
MGGGPSRVGANALDVVPPSCCFVPATDGRLHFRGRIVKNKEGVCFDWPCTSFKFKTSASRAWLRMDGGRNYFNVLINGSLVCVLKTFSAVRDYLVPTDGESIVEVQKRTEAKIGSITQKETSSVTLHGLVLEDGSLEDLPQDTPKRLEFLGDSETSGFGNLGPSQPGVPNLRSVLTVNVAHQDANQAWPALVAKAFGADFHNISWSGAGVVWNAGAGCSADAPFHDLYSRALGSSQTTSIDGEWQPDAVVLYLGGNDWWSLSHKGEEPLIAGFRRFLRHLREHRGPDVAICILLASPESVCACIGSLEDQRAFAADMSRCWRAAAEQLEDPKVYWDVVDPKPPCSLSDPADWGQMGHWSVQGNSKWANAVIPILESRLDWSRI